MAVTPTKGKLSGVDARLRERMRQTPTALPIYVLGLDSFERGDINDASLVGWHYVVADKAGNAGVDVYVDNKQTRHTFGAVNRGAIVDETVAQLSSAREDARYAEERDYEVRILRVPALYLVALWLKAYQAGHDRFVSVGPALSTLAAGSGHSWSELHQRLRMQAQARIRNDIPAKGQPGRRR